MQNTIKSSTITERKVISVSTRRQLTIPQKYFDILGFNNEAECILQDGGLFIRPLQHTGVGDFSEQILADLISQGFEGQSLLAKFKEYSKKIRPAVLKLLEETEDFANSGEGCIPLDELFGSEE